MKYCRFLCSFVGCDRFFVGMCGGGWGGILRDFVGFVGWGGVGWGGVGWVEQDKLGWGVVGWAVTGWGHF